MTALSLPHSAAVGDAFQCLVPLAGHDQPHPRRESGLSPAGLLHEMVSQRTKTLKTFQLVFPHSLQWRQSWLHLTCPALGGWHGAGLHPRGAGAEGGLVPVGRVERPGTCGCVQG